MSVNQNIALKRKKEEFIIALRGDLDHHGTQQLRADLEDALLACREMRVVFELSEVSFMDSSGIGLLLGRYKALKTGAVRWSCAARSRRWTSFWQ